jgi:hypothetical protein
MTQVPKQGRAEACEGGSPASSMVVELQVKRRTASFALPLAWLTRLISLSFDGVYRPARPKYSITQ